MEALAAYDKAIALTPNNADIHYNRGNALSDAGRFAEAVASFDAGKMVDVARYLSGESRVAEAIKVLDQADAMDAPRAESLIVRVRLMLQSGQISVAQTRFMRASN